MAATFLEARRNAMLDTLTAPCNSGFLRVYDGAVPADADAALAGNTLLAELTMNATSFPAAAAGVLTANAITQDASANNTGTASFFRIYQSDGTTCVLQGTVTATGGGGDLQFATVSFVAGAVVQVTALTISMP